MQRRIVVIAAALAVGLLPACASSGPMSGAQARAVLLGSADGPSRPVPQAVWEAVLAEYRAHRRATSGDVVRLMQLLTRRGEGGLAPTFLLVRRDSSLPGFSRDWILDLLHHGLIDGVCAARAPASCGQRQVTTYLMLDEPTWDREQRWDVRVIEFAVGPTFCAHAGSQAVVDARLWTRWWVERSGGAYRVIDHAVEAQAGPTC